MKTQQTLLALLILFVGQQSVLAQISEQEIERREAAAGVVLPMVMGLGILRLECGKWPQGDAYINQVAKGWWDRNRDSLDAAFWVITQAVHRYRTTMSPENGAMAERKMEQATTDASLASLRTVFASELPTLQLCQKAIQRYDVKELDIANLARAPGFERFGEFGDTIKRVLADKDFRPMDEKYRTFAAQVAIASTPLITMDAIEAAKVRGDAAGVVRGFESLAERGNPRAAHTLGVFSLNGQYVARNPQAARGWFYNAWAMGNSDGADALGVMLRDGVGGPADPTLSLATFAVAKQMASKGSVEELQRSASNYARLSQQLSATDVAEAGCLAWADLHRKVRQLAEKSGVTLIAPPRVPQGNLFDSNTFSRTQADHIVCRS